MRKNVSKVVVVALSVLTGLTGVSSYSGAITSLEEKPLAGITVSLGRFCEQKIENAAEDAAIAAQELAAAEETADTSSKEDAETDKEQEEISKKKEEAIKLNYNPATLGMAQVDNYLNVRQKPSENAKIVGKMTKNSACKIVSEKGDWYKIESGKVSGYVKAEYIITGEAAQKKAYSVATLKAIVKTQTLNVRFLPTTDASIYDQLSEDEDYTVEKEKLSRDYIQSFIQKRISKKEMQKIDTEEMYHDLSNWVMLSVDDEKVFVSKDFVDLKYRVSSAVTIKEEKKTSGSSSGSGTGSSMVSYAMQFLGNPYVWGGTSLTHGTDCSGFTQGIYRHFGKYIPRTSSAQAAYTRSVSSSEVRPGDLFFYGSGSVSHVAMYIGNGQIIHASNHRDGIKISNAYYRRPLKIGRVG